MLSYFQGMGDGWSAAVLDDQKEYDFIMQAQRSFTDAKSYWIGGSTNAEPYEYFDYNLYIVGDSGDK